MGALKPRVQPKEEEIPKNLTVNLSGDFGCLGEMKETEIPGTYFKGLAHGLSHPLTHTRGSGGRMESQEVQKSYVGRLHYVALE